MTLIEFFSSEQIENIISSLILKPQKIIFVGYSELMSTDVQRDIKKYLDKKGIKSQTEFVYVEKYDLGNIIKNLTFIYINNRDCIFDFTGGDGIVLAGMGCIMSEYDVRAVYYNVSEGVFYKNFAKDKTAEKIEISNSVEDNIILHGGMVRKTKRAYIKGEISEDVGQLFNICNKNNSLWNVTVDVLKNLDSNKMPADMRNSVFASLEEKGFISVRKTDEEFIYFDYKNDVTEICLKDPGTVLELYVYCLLEESGLFNDVDVGVNIDWDGIIHNVTEKAKDTSNEIDVAAMDGVSPVYISCKNGKVSKDTLYELDTVSKRFGGKYAEKILVAPLLSKNSISNEYILNRANDMNIKIVTDASQILKTIKKFA